MRCVPRALVAGPAVAVLLAACGTIGGPDPCGDATTCVRVDVDSFVVATIDQLELDVVYGDVHGTTTTGTAGVPIDLPLSTAIILAQPSTLLIQIDVVAGGKLGGTLLGADAASTTFQQGHRATLGIDLQPVKPCTEGAVYCGGSDIVGQYSTLYQCTRGFPIFYARCKSSCTSRVDEVGECFGTGLCRDGGTYCGGNVLTGDPYTLYVCQDYEGSEPTPCPRGCLVSGDGNDVCK
jgi:hypothetical protein